MPHDATPIATPRRLPVWVMGLANCPTGFVFGFISTAMGILLAARHVPVAQIGAISVVAFSPAMWGWLLSPVLDVRFTKRFYGFLFVSLAALLLGAAVLSLGNLKVFTALLTASCLCAVLYSGAVAGWSPDALDEADYGTMSGWFQLANLGAAGLFSVAVVVTVRHLPLVLAAGCLAAGVFAPSLLLLGFPRPRRPEGTLRANFAAMRQSLRAVFAGTRVWIGLVLFLSPVGAFALTNLFSAFGGDFGAQERAVTALNGPGVALACAAGCLLAIPLCKRFSRRNVYLLAAVGAGMCAVLMAFAPRTAVVYAAGLLAYNMCQGFNYTAYTVLSLEIVGPGNALAGTMMAVLTAAVNVPITAMTWVDGHVHDASGVRTMFLVDGGSALLTAAVLFAVVLPRLDRWQRRRAG